MHKKNKNKTMMSKCLVSSSAAKQQEKQNWNLNYLSKGGSESYLLGLELAMELMWWSPWQVVMAGGDGVDAMESWATNLDMMAGGDGVDTMESWATNLDMMAGLLELLELPQWRWKPRTTKDGRRFARKGRGGRAGGRGRGWGGW
jgi:hypothetical protein